MEAQELRTLQGSERKDDMTYTFDVKLFDNELDEVFERFSESALHRLAKLCCGTFGVFRGKPVAEVLEAHVVVEKDKRAKAGDLYKWVKARVKIPLTEKTSALVFEIEHGLRSKVNIGCSFRERICSICGVRGCSHTPGEYYDGKLCYMELCDVDDIFEWGFVEEVGAKKKFKICELLGVEIEERFQSPFDGADICIDKCGLPQFPDYPKNKVPAWIIADMINKPDTLIRKKKWTVQEIEDAKAIQRMFGKSRYTHVKKTNDGDVKIVGFVEGDTKQEFCGAVLHPDRFPSLKPGETVELNKIVGEDK